MGTERKDTHVGVITFIYGELKGRKYTLKDGQTLTIGRGNDVDVVLPASYTYASRNHCSITYDGINGMFFIVDTSSNGIYNAKGHRGKEQTYVKSGEMIGIGEKQCSFVLSEEILELPSSVPMEGYDHNPDPFVDNKGQAVSKTPAKTSVKKKLATAALIALPILAAAGAGLGFVLHLNKSISEVPNAAAKLIGGMAEGSDPTKGDDLTDDEEKEYEEQAKDYEDSSDEVAKETRFTYYRNQLTDEEKNMYDAFLQLANDPVDPNNVARCECSDIDINSDEFNERYIRTLYAMLFDHPESFWLYSHVDELRYQTGNDHESTGMVYFTISNKPDKSEYESEKKEFEKAADKFMKDIDLSQSDYEIAKDIHDKLCDMVTYDNAACEKQGSDYAHTAFGALVRDSEGIDNYAVCDGYSQAYKYLLQKAGIEGLVIAGVGGTTKYDAGGHAWSMVRLDGDWYEVDATWDDPGTLDEQIADIKRSSDRKEYEEAMDDDDYREHVYHHMLDLTTDEIEHYVPDDDDYYELKDGSGEICLTGESVHYRATTENYNDIRNGVLDFYRPVIDLAPIAYGTKY